MYLFIYTAHTPGAYPKTNNPTVWEASWAPRGLGGGRWNFLYPAHTRRIPKNNRGAPLASHWPFLGNF